MSNNYPYDPESKVNRNVTPVSNPATPSSGRGGTVPEIPLPAGGQSGLLSTSSGTNAGDRRRLFPGTELSRGRYKIEKLVAAGGMGAVYRAVDTNLEDTCAIKEMLDEFQSDGERVQAVDWFKREAKLLRDLNHSCIPRVRDFFVEGGKHYLVMDFIEGRTLGDMLEKEGNIAGLNGARGVSEARARSWGQQVCSVLGYLHRQNPPIIFRDLKPSNIMVTGRDEVKLIDFGIARTFQSQRQATIIMTVGYAPPEQLLGSPEPRSDLYALGSTLHRVLTRHDAANNKPNLYSFPPIRSLRPDIAVAFEQVIMRALAPNLEQRWTNAAEMERAIISLPPPGPAPQPGPPQPGSNRPANPQTPSSIMPGPGMPPATTGITGPGGALISPALSHLSAGRIEAAYMAVNQAFALEPNNSLVHRIYGQVFARRQPPSPDQAIQAYNRSLQLNPNDAETHKLVGDVSLFLRRQPLQAIPAYTQSLRLNANDFEAHQRLGQCYEETNQFDPALREYQEAVRLAPTGSKQPALQFALGQLAMRMSQLPLAERSFVQVLTINPADHQTRFLLSQVYENEGKFEDAFRECSYVIGPLAANPAVQAMFQRLRVRLGR